MAYLTGPPQRLVRVAGERGAAAGFVSPRGPPPFRPRSRRARGASGSPTRSKTAAASASTPAADGLASARRSLGNLSAHSGAGRTPTHNSITPSTTYASMSDEVACSAVVVHVQPSRRNLELGQQRTFELAVAGASEEYQRQASDILGLGDEALDGAATTPGFNEALVRQGLLLEDLKSTSPLAPARRAALLAAVLQEMDLQEASPPPPTPQPVALKRRLAERHAEAVEKIQANAEHRQEVLERQVAAAKASTLQMEQRASRQEEERKQHVREREALIEVQRRQRAESREEQRKAVVARAAELAEGRLLVRQASLKSQEQRSSSCLQLHSESRTEQIQQRMQARFQRVREVAQRSSEEQEARTRHLCEKWERQQRRSTSVIEARHVDLEQRSARQREHSEERRHQTLRLQRVKEHQRFVLLHEAEKDRTNFAEFCRQRSAVRLSRSSISSVNGAMCDTRDVARQAASQERVSVQDAPREGMPSRPVANTAKPIVNSVSAKSL